jgi:hypothetical protein
MKRLSLLLLWIAALGLVFSPNASAIQFITKGPANTVATNTANFDGTLSAADVNVQLALETIDDYIPVLEPYAQIVPVAKSGGTYSVIQTAVDSITDATTTKRYAILVYPGDYAENVVMEDYVDIIGINRTTTRITPTSGTAITFPATKGTVAQMGVYVNYGTLGANSTAIASAGADSAMIDCDIEVTKAAGDFTMRALSVTGGDFRLYQSRLTYSITAGAGNALIQSAVYHNGASDVLLFNNEITSSIAATSDDEIVGFETEAASTGTFIINDNIIEVVTLGTGSATGLYLFGTATTATIARNRFVVTSDTSVSYDTSAYWVDSTGNNAVVESAHNNMTITSAGVARSYVVATGDTVNSFFDGIIATSGYTGAGTVSYVSSPSAGNLQVSGYAISDMQVLDDADIVSDNISSLQARKGVIITNDGKGGAADYNLLAGTKGDAYYFFAEEAQTITIDVADADDIIVLLDGTALDAGDSIISDGNAGSSITIVCHTGDGGTATSYFYVHSQVGAWTDNGA